MKKLSLFISGIVGLILLSGCSSKDVEISDKDLEICYQEGVRAPSWTCVPFVENSYFGLGIAGKSGAGMGHMRVVALSKGRAEIAHQISSLVKGPNFLLGHWEELERLEEMAA